MEAFASEIARFAEAAEASPETLPDNVKWESIASPCKIRAPPSSAPYLSDSLKTEYTYLYAGKAEAQSPSANIATSFVSRRFPLKCFILERYFNAP